MALLGALAAIVATTGSGAAPRAQEAGGPQLSDLELSSYRVAAYRTLADEAIDESSGLAHSRRHPGVLWTHNDSGGAPALYAVGADGRSLGSFLLQGVDNRDWEDLTAFELEGTAYLLVADIGDNSARHEQVRFHVVEEPSLDPRSGLPEGAGGPVAWTVRFVYEDGPRDAESVFVVPGTGRVIVLSKRTRPPVLYEVPLRSETGEREVARRIGEVRTLPAPAPGATKLGKYGFQPTSMDVSADGRRVVVLTYRFAFLFPLDEAGPASMLDTLPQRVPVPVLRQQEGICFSPFDDRIYVSSEKLPAELIELALPPGSEAPIRAGKEEMP